MSRSTFPQKVDSFEELYDLPPSLVASAKRYQELKIKPTLNATEQAELNTLSGTLGNYVITPETWNKLGDAIVNVETFFNQEVNDYILQKQKEWNGYLEGFKSVGDYNPTTIYKYSNMVTYSGSLFLCISKGNTVGITPNLTADNEHWQKISSKGDKGDVGLNVALRGDYSPTEVYAIGDAVRFEGRLYYCVKATTAGLNPSNVSHWLLYEGTFFGAAEPSQGQEGTLWIEVLE